MSVRRLTRRESIAAAFTSVVVLGALSYAYVLEPGAMAFMAAHERAVQAQRELGKLHALAGHQETIEAEYARLQSGITTAESNQELGIALLNEVSGLVLQTGLQLVGIQPLKVARGSEFSRFGVEVQVQGEAHQFVNLLQQAQEERHLLKAETIALSVQRSQAPITATLRLTKLAQLQEAP